MSASNYLENELLDHVLSSSYTRPTTLYVGLFKNNASVAANLEANIKTDEVSGNGYSRRTVTFGAAANGSASNNAIVTFSPATANWGTISHVAIMDASTGGNVLFWGAVTVPKLIDTGDIFQIAVNNLTVTLD